MRTAIQRTVSKFTKDRSALLLDVSDPNGLSAKQKADLDTLFGTKIWHVFLPRSQSIASPAWMRKSVRVKDDGSREVTCRRGRPQLFSLIFTPDMTSEGVVDYVTGGTFAISGSGLEPSKIRCVVLKHTEPLPLQWALEGYDDADAEEEDAAAEAEDDGGDESSEEQDVNLHMPDGLQRPCHDEGLHSGSELDVVDDAEADECYEVWSGGCEDVETVEPMAAEHTDAINVSNAILRPRGKEASEEWIIFVQEGWAERLPKVVGSTIGRHSSKSAWSTRYPTSNGLRHFARHWGEHRSRLSALLQCAAWLCEQHYLHTQSEDIAKLTQELLARKFVEEDCALS